MFCAPCVLFKTWSGSCSLCRVEGEKVRGRALRGKRKNGNSYCSRGEDTSCVIWQWQTPNLVRTHGFGATKGTLAWQARSGLKVNDFPQWLHWMRLLYHYWVYWDYDHDDTWNYCGSKIHILSLRGNSCRSLRLKGQQFITHKGDGGGGGGGGIHNSDYPAYWVEGTTWITWVSTGVPEVWGHMIQRYGTDWACQHIKKLLVDVMYTFCSSPAVWHRYQGRIQEIGKEGAELRQARAARGVRGHVPLENLEIWAFQTAISCIFRPLSRCNKRSEY